VQLKDILVRDLLLPDAVRSGRTELERVYLPLSSLLTWAAGLGCALAVCGSLGLRLEPLLAVGGAGGIAAGFASQQVLTNMVSGEKVVQATYSVSSFFVPCTVASCLVYNESQPALLQSCCSCVKGAPACRAGRQKHMIIKCSYMPSEAWMEHIEFGR
jgi:hypothetical protein